MQSQVRSAGKEKDELSQRLKVVKDAAKQSLQASSKRCYVHSVLPLVIDRIYASLEAVRTAMGDLKTKSEESFGVITNLRASMPDVQDLRNSISSAMRSELFI